MKFSLRSELPSLASYRYRSVQYSVSSNLQPHKKYCGIIKKTDEKCTYYA